MTIQTPVDVFEGFVKDGEYLLMKQHESFLKQAKGFLKDELINFPVKRHEYPDIDMVAKFVPKKIQTTNHSGIIEDLFDYVKPELVTQLLTLDMKKMREVEADTKANAFLLPQTYFVRPNFNKVGKKYTSVREYMFGGQSVEQLLNEIKFVSNQHEQSVVAYNGVKEKLYNYSELVEKNSVKTTIGSISRIANTPTWDMNKIYLQLGEDFLKLFGKVKLSEIDEWVLTERIPKSIVTKNRTLVDIQLDFVVMSMATESRIMAIQRNRKSRLSLERLA